MAAGLDPLLDEKAQQLLALARKEGIELRVTTGYRSPEEQARLYAQGRTTPGAIVTKARPGRSRHQSGRAIDVAIFEGGKPDWKSPQWTRVGELGKSLGLVWGGDFKGLDDRTHFELAQGSGSPQAAPPSQPAAAAARPAPDKATLTRLIQLHALKAGVDPDLAVAVATQESGLNPNTVGDNGKSLSLFQLQRAAAIDAGIDPARRGEIAQNIRGGIAYLKQGLDRFGGDPRQALERHYNRGGDPDYYAHVMQYYPGGAPAPQRPGLLSRVGAVMSPASAEAAQPTAPPGALRPADRAALEQRLQQLKALQFPGEPPAAATPAPAAPVQAAPVQAAPVALAPPPPAGLPQPHPAPAAQAPIPTAQTQVQMLQQQEQARLAAEREVGSPTVPAGPRQELFRQLAAGGISAGGAMLGTAAGTLVAPFTGPLAPAMPLVGEMAGSYLSRQANVALGLEEPGVVGDVASVAVPPLLRGAARAVPAVAKAVIRKLPGASTGMHQEVWERLGKMKQTLLPPEAADLVYNRVAQYNPAIGTTAIFREATDILQAEMALQPSLRNPRLVRVARDLQRLTQGGSVPMEDLYAHQKRVGELVGDFRSKGGVGEGRIKQLYAAFHEDLETAAGKGVRGAQELKDAIAASRKEHIAAEFNDLFQPGKSGILIDPEGRVSLHGGRMKTAWDTKLRRDKVFRDTLDPTEKAEVEDILTLAQRLERLRTPKGVQFGSGRALARGTLASGVAVLTGMNPIMVGAVAMNAPELIGKAMQTSAGRALVKKALQDSGGAIDTTALNGIAAVVRQQMNVPEPSQAPTP